MTARDYLSEDGLAVLLLCSMLGLDERKAPGFVPPLTLSEWNKLEGKISPSSLKGPSGLFGQNARELGETLDLPSEEAERVLKLLGRASRLTLELENLFTRGIWVLTRVDDHYPMRLRNTLKHLAPSVLFGAGEINLLRKPGLAVIGSRNIDAPGISFAQEVGQKSAAAKLSVVSGGAKGTDRLAMQGGLEAGGTAFGVLADSLERTVSQPEVRQFLLDGQLVLVTPYAPSAGFSVGGAMGRNKVIYGLAEFAVVVSSDFQTGGTWSGAIEALKANWCPVFARDGDVPKGNKELMKRGALPLLEEAVRGSSDLPQLLRELAPRQTAEQDLFGSAL